MLLSLLLIVAGATAIACCFSYSSCYWCRLVPDVDNVAGLPATVLLTSLRCCWCSCCCFMPAVADDLPVDPSIPILARDMLDYQLQDHNFQTVNVSAIRLAQ